MSTKTVKNIREPLKKPRSLKSASVDSAPKDTLNMKARADLLAELEILNVRIGNCDFDEIVTADIAQMCSLLKKNGEELDTVHKDALDRFFSTLRNICCEDRLDAVSRLKLLEVIEMRAMCWRTNENLTNYFTTKLSQLEEASKRQLSGSISPNALLNVKNQNFSPSVALAPGEVLRSSGKFSKPTKIADQNYFKDEIVIRNCDSGKGARDRLVQITGPHEEAIRLSPPEVLAAIIHGIRIILSADSLSQPSSIRIRLTHFCNMHAGGIQDNGHSVEIFKCFGHDHVFKSTLK